MTLDSPVREPQAPAARRPVRLAAGVVVLDDLDGGPRERLVELPGGRMTRVGADLGRLLDEVRREDGDASAEGLAMRLGRPWTPGVVADTVRRLDEMGITDGAAARAHRRERRLEYRPPLSLQLTLVRPERILPAGAPALRALTGPRAAAAALAALAAGIPALAVSLAQGGPLHRPAGLATYVLALVGLLLTVSIHELAHGATLAAGGGRPRRMGVMIFYLLPAFFCDVSDAWRLSPAARVRVALAGIVAQGALAGLAALAALPATGALEQGLAFYALLAYGYGAVNLLPFLKLDGYVALTGGLDIPNLRRKAMQDVSDAIAHVALGARPVPRRLPGRWPLAFGAACIVTPGVVLVSAVATLGPSLLPIGAGAAVVGLALAVLLAVLLVHALARWLAGALRNGAPAPRVAAAAVATALAVAALLATVHVPRTLHGGLATVDGRPVLVLGLGAAGAEDLRPGASVTIARNGLLPGETVAHATVAGRARDCRAPLGAIVPVRDANHTLAARCTPLRLAGTAPRSGRATTRLAAVPAGERLVELLVTPSLEALGL